ncbi:MAG: type VI secretion system baseplate subunit TssF [Myxococcota bacterium]
MDPRLLAYYNRELHYLRELGGEFAKQFPKIAGRLGLETFECSDPYVERLLEGFAFLAARVQLKIDAEFPRFTEHLLTMVYPHYLAPTPSMAVVKMFPNHRQGVLNEGFVVPRDTSLRSLIGRGEQTACEYRTAHDVTLFPIEIASVAHTSYVGDLGEIRIIGAKPIRGALRLRLRTLNGAPFSQVKLETLPLFLSGTEQMSVRLYELLFAGTQGLLIRGPNGGPKTLVSKQPLRPVGFDDSEALLPYTAKSFQGYRLLQEYFALPQRFMFAELAGLFEGVQSVEEPEIEIIVLLDRHDPVVEAAVAPTHFELFCTPCVNLFPKRVDRIHLSDRVSQYHIVTDRTRPVDFEVHSVTEVLGYGSSTDVRREFQPFYACKDRTVNLEDQGAYYTLHRETRMASSRQRRAGPRSTYPGTEMFISLVDGNQGPFSPDLKQLAINALCTNRDLPLQMNLGLGSTDFTLESGAPVDSIRVVGGPSEPRPSSAWGATSWRIVSHLSLNYLSITERNEGDGAAGLRELLHLYGDFGTAATRRQIDGVRAVSSNHVVRRLPVDGPASFGRGLEIRVDCDETAFEGASVFLFGAVLERFFAKYASINSFTETVLRTLQRGEIMRYSTRVGRRAIA